MKSKLLYPQLETEPGIRQYDYDPILESFGEILLKIDDQDYSGDSRVLYKKNNKYGWLIFGWGSCSGCDALQSCESYEEIEELINSLESGIEWFDTLEDLKTRFKTKDWALIYSFHEEETREFIKQVLEYKESNTEEVGK